MDGRMYVLMEKKDWVSQASRGTSRSRSRLGRTGTIDKLRAHAVERMLTAARPASALADDPMRQLEEHLGSFAEGARASKRSRLPLAGMSPGFVQVPARVVAPPGLDLPADETAFDVYVLPRPTAPPGIFVLVSQVAALIADARYERLELEQFEAPVLSGLSVFQSARGRFELSCCAGGEVVN